MKRAVEQDKSESDNNTKLNQSAACVLTAYK